MPVVPPRAPSESSEGHTSPPLSPSLGGALPAAPTTCAGAEDGEADATRPEGVEGTGPLFQLLVRLADQQEATLAFRSGAALPRCVGDFVAAHSLKAIFQEPLLGHVEL